MTNVLDDKLDALAQLVHGIDATSRGGLDTVQALRMIRETADSAIPNAVAQARAEGETWDAIGKQLGMTRQAAWERFT